MRTTSIVGSLLVTAALAVLAAGTALAHGKNDLNRNHPGRTQATTGNFRRQAVINATGADKNAWVRPLARAIAFSAKDQRPILSRIAKYRANGEELALVSMNNGTGKVKMVAIPTDKELKVRELKPAEIYKLGLTPQYAVVPGLLGKVKSSQFGAAPLKTIKASSLSTSGLSYQGQFEVKTNSKPNRKLEKGEYMAREGLVSLPLTAHKNKLAGAYITGWEYIHSPSN